MIHVRGRFNKTTSKLHDEAKQQAARDILDDKDYVSRKEFNQSYKKNFGERFAEIVKTRFETESK